MRRERACARSECASETDVSRRTSTTRTTLAWPRTFGTHTCTCRTSSDNFRAKLRATLDRDWGRGRPPHASTPHGMRWSGVDAPTEFLRRDMLSRQSSRAASRTIGRRATRTVAAARGDWRAARAADLNPKRRHELGEGSKAGNSTRGNRRRVIGWRRLRCVAIGRRDRASRSYWTTPRVGALDALRRPRLADDIPFSIVCCLQGRARNVSAIYIRNIIYVIEELFERVNCYLDSMSLSDVHRYVFDDDDVSKSRRLGGYRDRVFTKWLF